MSLKTCLLFFTTVLFLFSCKVDPQILPELPTDDLVEVLPPGWPQPHYTFTANSVSRDKFILGRALFYETMLSADNTISCGSCHLDISAFSNPGHEVSHGIYGLKGIRNAPGLFNLNWHPYYMHDGGVNNLEMQPLAPLTNTVEMDEKINSVILKLQASSKYRTLFKNAYGRDTVTSEGFLKAMAQFMGMMYSYNSKFDFYKRGENNVQLNETELRGYDLFKANCNSCHTEPLFSDFKFRSNGLPIDPLKRDSGRAHIESLPENRYVFKTPSLRNIAKTPPYMHDGRFEALEQCIDYYTKPKTNLINLDPLLQNPINLSEQDKKDILAFLNTLTDYQFITDKRFSDPNARHP